MTHRPVVFIGHRFAVPEGADEPDPWGMYLNRRCAACGCWVSFTDGLVVRAIERCEAAEAANPGSPLAPLCVCPGCASHRQALAIFTGAT